MVVGGRLDGSGGSVVVLVVVLVLVLVLVEELVEEVDVDVDEEVVIMRSQAPVTRSLLKPGAQLHK